MSEKKDIISVVRGDFSTGVHSKGIVSFIRWATVFLVFAIPIHLLLSSIAAVTLLSVTVLGVLFKKIPVGAISRSPHVSVLIFAAIYLFYVIGTFYSHDVGVALFDLQVKLPLAAFPLLFLVIPRLFDVNRSFPKIFAAFTAGVAVGSVIMLITAVYSYKETGNANEFFSSRLSGLFHPSYYAMYTVMAMLSVIWMAFNGSIKPGAKKTIIYALLLIYFFIFTVLLSSKAGMVSLIIPAVYGLHLTYKKSGSRIAAVLFGGAFALIFVVSFYLFPHSFGRFTVMAKTINDQKPVYGDTSESTFQRMVVWGSAMRILYEHPATGVGTGDVKKSLLADYRSTGNYAGISGNLNAHNQYLQTSVALGLIGLTVLVATFIIPFIVAVRRRSWLYCSFLLLVSFNLLFESILERQAGVMFYAFFNSLLFVAMMQQRHKNIAAG